MPHDLEILYDTIDIWSFQFMCLSTIYVLDITLRVQVFLSIDIINISVLFTLRVSLLESNNSATLTNSKLGI